MLHIAHVPHSVNSPTIEQSELISWTIEYYLLILLFLSRVKPLSTIIWIYYIIITRSSWMKLASIALKICQILNWTDDQVVITYTLYIIIHNIRDVIDDVKWHLMKKKDKQTNNKFRWIYWNPMTSVCHEGEPIKDIDCIFSFIF